MKFYNLTFTIWVCGWSLRQRLRLFQVFQYIICLRNINYTLIELTLLGSESCNEWTLGGTLVLIFLGETLLKPHTYWLDCNIGSSLQWTAKHRTSLMFANDIYNDNDGGGIWRLSSSNFMRIFFIIANIISVDIALEVLLFLAVFFFFFFGADAYKLVKWVSVSISVF